MAILERSARQANTQPDLAAFFRADGNILHTIYLGDDDECQFFVWYASDHIIRTFLHRVNGERPTPEHAAYQAEFDDLLADFGDVFQSVMDAIADQ